MVLALVNHCTPNIWGHDSLEHVWTTMVGIWLRSVLPCMVLIYMERFSRNSFLKIYISLASVASHNIEWSTVSVNSWLL